MLNVKTTNNYFERTGTLVKYFQDVREFDVLTPEQEKEIFNQFIEGREKAEQARKAGDHQLARRYEREASKIREAIINANLRFVISIARIYGTNGNILDIINEGNIGLCKAVDTFKPEMGNRFQTHAVYFVRREINLYRQGPDLMVKKSNESKTYHVQAGMTNKFLQEFEREPTSEELMEYINKYYPKANIRNAADCLTVRVSSIDEASDGDDEDANVSTMLSFNTSTATSNDYVAVSELEHYRSVIESLLKDFSERDRSIIKMHFGIGEKDGRQVPAMEIGKRINLTPERVRQIIADSIKKVQKEYANRIAAF